MFLHVVFACKICQVFLMKYLFFWAITKKKQRCYEENVRLCDKSCPEEEHRAWQVGSPNNSFPRSHQPVPDPSAQARRGTGNSSRQESKFRTLEKGHPVLACPWRVSALLVMCEAHQDQSTLDHLLNWREHTEGWGTHCGMQGKSISEPCESCYGMLMWGSADRQRDRLRGMSVGKAAG